MIVPLDFPTLLLAFINAATFDNGLIFPHAWSCIPFLLATIVSARRAFDYTRRSCRPLPSQVMSASRKKRSVLALLQMISCIFGRAATLIVLQVSLWRLNHETQRQSNYPECVDGL